MASQCRGVFLSSSLPGSVNHPGNLTLWLNNCGLYDRKATESSHGAVQPSSHGALDLLSCSRRLEMGNGSRTTDREKGPASVSEVWREGVAHPLGQVAPCARKVHVPQDQSSKLRREFPPFSRRKCLWSGMGRREQCHIRRSRRFSIIQPATLRS